MGLIATGLIVVPTAQAAPSDFPLKIRLVDPDVGGDPEAELVMLQMTVDGQGDQTGNEVRFYGPTGSLTDAFTIPGAVAVGQAGRTILIAPAASSPAPDFALAPADRIDPSGGAVCFVGEPEDDCVAWGSFPSALLSSLPDPQWAGAEAIFGAALGREIDRDCPTWLGPLDDVANASSDFVDGVPPPPLEPQPPAPRSNATLPGAASPTETPCPLDTGFNQTPPNPTNDTTPTFAFGEIAPEYGATFECRFSPGPSIPPAQAWLPCPPSGNTYGPLSDGIYTFGTRAIGYAGTDPSPLNWTFEVDTVPPDTQITGVPPSPSSGFSATFSFKSTEPHSKFACQFESGPLQPCESPKTLFNLSDGPHTFRVWASDQATNVDPSPAVHSFEVDTRIGDLNPPETTLLSRPPKRSLKPSASFAYRSSEPRSTFQCRLDDGPFETCDEKGVVYPGLKNGPHSFGVRATDRARNTDPVPVSYSWSVEAPLPKTTITASPPGAQRVKGKRARVRFSFRSSKPGSTFRCRLGKRRFKPCRSTFRARVRPGRHRFEVYAIDSLGNQEAGPKRRLFRVIRKSGGGRFF